MTVVEKLGAAIRIPTVAADAGETAEAETQLRAFQHFLTESFPLVHRTLEREAPGPYRLLYRWPGQRGADAAEHGKAGAPPDLSGPILLMAHYDVVPAPPEGWSIPPFSGEVRDGAVWGRGAIDNKTSLIAIMEAVETLIAEGIRPRCDVYLAFGGDEEIGGHRGAVAIVENLRSRGVHLALTLDEGAIVAEGMLPGITTPVGLIGCGEKGHMDVRVSVASAGGHASNPLPQDPTASLAVAIQRILRRRQPTRRTATVTAFVNALGRSIGGMQGAILRAYPLTKALVHRALSRAPETDSMIRNTHAVTMMEGSAAPNVLPASRWANLNIRLLPGETIDQVLERLRRRTGRPRRFGALRHPVHIELAPTGDHGEAPAESPVEGSAYQAMHRAITAVWPGIPVLPYLVTATTDSRYYAAISDAVYRFLPYRLGRGDLAGVHGVDEHISIENIESAVRFYRTILRETGATP